MMVRPETWRAFWGRGIMLLPILLLFSACSQGARSDEELRQEIQELKKEVKAVQGRLEQLQAGQQAQLDFLKKSRAAAEVAAAPPPQPPTPQALTVGQLLAGRERYLGNRVTVRGEVGPVLVHHKSLLLKSPEGMVEVFFGKLPDEKLVQRLASGPIGPPLTVTGVVSLPPRTGAAKLQINAEAIEF